MKASFSRSRAIATNYFFLISLTCVIIRSISAIVYILYWRWRSTMLISIFFKVKKSISRVISMLMSANKNISSKKQKFLFLFLTKKETTTISKVSSFESSIFWVLTLVSYIRRSSFFAKSGLIALTSILKSIRA